MLKMTNTMNSSEEVDVVNLEDVKEEILIELVKQNEAIYKPTNENYKNLKYKEDIWIAIAEECGYNSANEAKSKWRNLKDTYRSIRKRNEKRQQSGATATKTKVWKYYEQMGFMNDIIKHGEKTSSNITSRGPQQKTPPIVNSDDEENQCESSAEESDNETRSFRSSTTSKRKASLADVDGAIMELLNMHKKRKENPKKAEPIENDPLKIFFLSTYSTVKQFSKANQLKAWADQQHRAGELHTSQITTGGGPGIADTYLSPTTNKIISAMGGCKSFAGNECVHEFGLSSNLQDTANWENHILPAGSASTNLMANIEDIIVKEVTADFSLNKRENKYTETPLKRMKIIPQVGEKKPKPKIVQKLLGEFEGSTYKEISEEMKKQTSAMENIGNALQQIKEEMKRSNDMQECQTNALINLIQFITHH